MVKPYRTRKQAVYIRTSTKTNKDKSGPARQRAACKSNRDKKIKIAKEVVEVISGSLPLEHRKKLRELIDEASRKKFDIKVESARAISRDMVVNEEIYAASKKAGVEIIACDMPDLYDHNANPVQKFMRRTIFSYTELEKDLTVSRLQDGLRRRRSKVQKKVGMATTVRSRRLHSTQKGKVKFNGRLSILGKIKPNRKKISDLKQACRHHDKYGGIRGLAKKLATLSRNPHLPTSTARRMKVEIRERWGK